MKDKKNGIELTELFMATAGGDFSRCFHGTIKRGKDSDGNHMVCGRIKVLNGLIMAQAGTQDVLGARLDELVLMVLDMGLHDNAGVTSIIVGTNFYLN